MGKTTTPAGAQDMTGRGPWPPSVGPAAYRALFDNSPDGVLFTAPDGQVLAANAAACRILRMSEDEIRRVGRQGLADPSDHRWHDLLDLRRRLGAASGVARMRRGDGALIEVEMSAKVFLDDGEERACTVIRDITERLRLEQHLRALTAELTQLSLTDELTGLRNRRGVVTTGTQLLEVATRQQAEVQVLYLDVDNMKSVNDTYGHRAGDAGLRVVAEALRATFRKADVIGRVGGDEFLVVALGVRDVDRPRLEQRISEYLVASQTVAGADHRVEVSLGWATRHPDDPSSLADLMAAADEVMYRSRAVRRGSTVRG
ncbi:MAG TPA: sensor domain-containing diguanylate cyclase [Acidimicrobiales bacterium]|nr:sensor domain-containing diguanylate cyclase [Acidimicrobiales bacterium]